jgi:excisionase family DNA binding protein
VADDLSASEAATVLGTSQQTIRNLAREGTLRGTQSRTGVWRIRRKSVDAFIHTYGRLDGGRRRKSPSAALEAEVRRLREEVAELMSASGVRETAALLVERDDLRAKVIGLEDALARMREAAELQRQAEVERSKVVDQLLAALGASDRADGLRRQALQTLEDGLASALMPGHPGTTS